MFNLTQEEKESLRKKYVGKKVHVIINDFWNPFEGEGIVEMVDDIGTLHGIWKDSKGKICTLGVVLGEDSARIIEN